MGGNNFYFCMVYILIIIVLICNKLIIGLNWHSIYKGGSNSGQTIACPLLLFLIVHSLVMHSYSWCGVLVCNGASAFFVISVE